MPVNKSLYQSIKDTGKKTYYQYVKPNIDKMRTDPILGGIISSRFYRPDFDARDSKSFPEAYKAAREEGAKTFIFNGGHYSTDYSGTHHKNYSKDLQSGKVKEFQKQNPGVTYPELVKAKQEELDTYGITNEYTKNKNDIEKVLSYALPTNSYSVIDAANEYLLDKRADVEYGIGKGLTKLPFGIGEKIGDKLIDHSNEIILENYNTRSQSAEDDATRRLYFGRPENLSDSFDGKPVMKISKYKPTIGGDKDYYMTYRPEIVKDIFDNKYKPTKKEIDSSYLKSVGAKEANYKNNDLYQDANAILGTFTSSKTKDYESIYDKWDLNPFGQGKDNSMIKIGNPINIYDRRYSDKISAKKIKPIYKSISDKNKQ